MAASDAFAACDSVCWTSELLKLGPTVLLGLLAGYIAWKQQAIAHAKLNLDLFGRRIAVFDAAWTAASDAHLRRLGHREAMNALRNKFPEASFLFKPRVEEYLREIVDKMIQLETLEQRSGSAQQQNPLSEDENAKLLELHLALEYAAKKGLREIFGPYLNFAGWK